jgi:hypothetical protein
MGLPINIDFPTGQKINFVRDVGVTKQYFGGSDDGIEMPPREYKKREYSGICICTHNSEDHHGDMILNIEVSNATGEHRMAGECEFYGFNEDTDSHCPHFWDKGNPDPDPYAAKRPDPPSKEIGDIWYRFKLFKWALEDIKDLPERPTKPHSEKEFEDRAYNEALWACQEIADKYLEKDKTL